MKTIAIIAHKGTKFESQGSGKFAKDVLRVGDWHHPATGQAVKITRERLEKLTDASNRFVKNGNKIPFPDGHSWKTQDNMGFWPGPFLIQGSELFAVVEPKSAKAIEKIQDGSLDSVSVVMEGPYTDTEGNQYDEVVTQICGTNYPVVTKQKGFIKLSRDGNQYDVAVLIPKEKEVDPNQASLDQMALAFGNCVSSQADRVAIALQGKPGRTFDECVQIFMRERGIDKERASALCATLARRAGELSVGDALALAAMEEKQGKRIELQAFPGGFKGCVAAMRGRPGIVDPEAVCAEIGRRAGKIA